MSDKKLYQLDDKASLGQTDLVYVASANGSGDGKASWSQLRPVIGGVLAPVFAAFAHTHVVADITDLAAVGASNDYNDLDNLPSLFDGAYASLTSVPAAIDAIDGLTPAADRLPYYTGASAGALATFTAAGRALVDDADTAAQRTTLGLVIGTDVQAYHARLADIAGITFAQGDILYFNGTNLVKLAAGTSGFFLKTQGAAANPTWALPSGGTIADADYGDMVVSGSGTVMTVDSSAITTSKIAAGAVTLAKIGDTTPIVAPQGRLTLTSNTPIMTADATAQGTVYYTPYVGAVLPIYDGSNWAPRAFSQISLALNSTDNLLNNLYDIFVFNNSGTLTLGTGPAWINTATVTITNASPGVISWTAHGLVEGDPVVFTTTGGLPTGLTAGTTYYVSKTSLAANSFVVSTSVANASAGTNVNTSSAGSGTHTGTNPTRVRGTGSGTTELELKDGIWTNKNAITLRAGGSSLGSISANQATYLGTAYMTANGQTGMAFQPTAASGGTNNILGLYNAYNRVRVTALARDSAVSWTYASTTPRPFDNSLSNRVSFVDGLKQSTVSGRIGCLAGISSTSTYGSIGLNLDGTSGAPSLLANFGAGPAGTQWPPVSLIDFAPQLGFHYLQGMEAMVNTGTVTFFGSGYANVAVTLDM